MYRWQGRPHVDEVVAAFVARRTVAEIAEEARARALPWAAVAKPSELADNPQLRHRKFFVDIDTPSGPVTNVGFPFASPERLTAPSHVDTVDWPARDAGPGGATGPRHSTAYGSWTSRGCSRART